MNYLRGEFRRERESNFAMLRRIPSTSVRMFLDYFSSLNESESEALLEALSQRALCMFFPSAPHPGQSDNSAFTRYADALPLMWSWKYEGTRDLKTMLAVARMDPGSTLAHEMSPEIKDWIGAIRPVKSTEIRRVVKLALAQSFDSLTVRHEVPYWRYEGSCRGRYVSAVFDYSSRHHQLDYQISFRRNEPAMELRLRGLNYERLFGMTSANWDCLEQANLDQSIALLKDLIAYCVELPKRLPGVLQLPNES